MRIYRKKQSVPLIYTCLPLIRCWGPRCFVDSPADLGLIERLKQVASGRCPSGLETLDRFIIACDLPDNILQLAGTTGASLEWREFGWELDDVQRLVIRNAMTDSVEGADVARQAMQMLVEFFAAHQRDFYRLGKLASDAPPTGWAGRYDGPGEPLHVSGATLRRVLDPHKLAWRHVARLWYGLSWLERAGDGRQPPVYVGGYRTHHYKVPPAVLAEFSGQADGTPPTGPPPQELRGDGWGRGAVPLETAGVTRDFLQTIAVERSCIPLLQKRRITSAGGNLERYELRRIVETRLTEIETRLFAEGELLRLKGLGPVERHTQARTRRPASLPIRLRDRILRRDRYRCIFCGASGVPLEVNHIVPKALVSRLKLDEGLFLAEYNLVTCCELCNRAKSDNLAREDVDHYLSAFAAPDHPNHAVVKHLELIRQLQSTT